MNFSAEENSFGDESSQSTVAIILGVCGGIFLVILLVVFCLCLNRRRNDEKPSISYPNSLVNGTAVQMSFNSHTERAKMLETIPESSDSESDFDEDETDSEDEIEKIKRKYNDEPVCDEKVSRPQVEFHIPKVDQGKLLEYDNGDAVDLLRRFADSFQEQRRPGQTYRKNDATFQESIVI